MAEGSILRALLNATLLAAACISANSSEVPPAFQWARHFAGTNYGHIWIHGHSMDELGNSYLAGFFALDLHVDGHVLPSGSIFLVKLDRSGNVVWARRDGGTNSEAYALARHSDGHLFTLAGVRTPPATIAGVLFTNDLPGHIVLAKYTPDGQGVWARSVGSSAPPALSAPQIAGIIVDSTGAIYWTGMIWGSATVGATNLSAPTPGMLAFLAKCDTNGTVVWVKAGLPADSSSSTTFGSPALDKDGNIYVCGAFAGTTLLGTTNLASNGEQDILVAKYNPNGDLLWVKRAGGAGSDYAFRNTTDSDGNFLVSGWFFHTATFGSVTATNHVATNILMVAKYAPDGEAQWAAPMCPGVGRFAVAADRANNVYFAGESHTNVVFTKMNAAGELCWTRMVPNAGRAMWLLWLHADAAGHCYASGQFRSGPIAFDEHVLTFSRTMNFDSWVTKLDTTTLPSLRMQRGGDVMVVQWSVLSEGFSLEWSTNLASAWHSNTTPPTATIDMHSVTLPTSGDRMFFRLRR